MLSSLCTLCLFLICIIIQYFSPEVECLGTIGEECAEVQLTQLAQHETIPNSTIFFLRSGEESFAKFKEIERQVGFPYTLKVKVRTGCAFETCVHWDPMCSQVYNDKDLNTTSAHQTDSVKCSCGGPCPSALYTNWTICPNEYIANEALMETGQCGWGYPYQFCGTCTNGYLAMDPGDVVTQSDQKFQIGSITLRHDCRLWNGKTVIQRSTDILSVDRNLPLVCNCSDEYNVTQDYWTNKINYDMSTSTLNPTSTSTSTFTTEPDDFVIYLSVFFALVCLTILSISLVLKFRSRLRNHLRISESDESIPLMSDEIPEAEIDTLQELTTHARFGVIELAEWNVGMTGEIRKCVLKSAARRTGEVHVRNDDAVYIRTVQRELNTLRKIRRLGGNPNIVQLFGVMTRNNDEIRIVLEYCEHRDLKSYLRQPFNRMSCVNVWPIMRQLRRVPNSGVHLERLRRGLEPNSLSTLMLINWCRDVASGMEFLVSSNILQIDLAARNVLLAGNYVAKLADFGMTKELNAENNVRFGTEDEECLPPFPWLAQEARPSRLFSVQSSVWAFGVTAWEILSLGENLYPGDPAGHRHVLTRKGWYKMAGRKPKHSSSNIHKRLLKCWKVDPANRPSFTDLKSFFGNKAQTLRNGMEILLRGRVPGPNVGPIYLNRIEDS